MKRSLVRPFQSLMLASLCLSMISPAAITSVAAQSRPPVVDSRTNLTKPDQSIPDAAWRPAGSAPLLKQDAPIATEREAIAPTTIAGSPPFELSEVIDTHDTYGYGYAAANGVVYSIIGNSVVARSLANKEQLWTHALPSGYTTIFTKIFVYQSNVVVAYQGSDDNGGSVAFIYGFQAATGGNAWTARSYGAINPVNVYSYDNIVYFESGNTASTIDRLTGVNMLTGAEVLNGAKPSGPLSLAGSFSSVIAVGAPSNGGIGWRLLNRQTLAQVFSYTPPFDSSATVHSTATADGAIAFSEQKPIDLDDNIFQTKVGLYSQAGSAGNTVTLKGRLTSDIYAVGNKIFFITCQFCNQTVTDSVMPNFIATLNVFSTSGTSLTREASVKIPQHGNFSYLTAADGYLYIVPERYGVADQSPLIVGYDIAAKMLVWESSITLSDGAGTQVVRDGAYLLVGLARSNGDMSLISLRQEGRMSDQDRTDCDCTKNEDYQRSAGVSDDSDVNTGTGNYNYGTQNIDVDSPDGTLHGGLEYNSQSVHPSTANPQRKLLVGQPQGLAAGWTHSYNMWLDTKSEPDTVIYNGSGGARLRFSAVDGLVPGAIFAPKSGIFASLEMVNITDPLLPSEVYIFTTRHDTKLYFNLQGQLLLIESDRGQRQKVINKDLGNGSWWVERVQSVTDPSIGLNFSYTNGYLSAITDPTNRSITFNHNATTGKLTSYTDLANAQETFGYTNDLLSERTNALGQLIERTTFISSTINNESMFRATAQQSFPNSTDGTSRKLQFNYNNPDRQIQLVNPSTNVVLETRVDRYGANKTIESQTLNGIKLSDATVGTNLVGTGKVDGLGRITKQTSNRMGRITSTTDALQRTSVITYDAKFRPIARLDYNNIRSILTYDNANNVIRETNGITTISPLGQTTIYTYNVRYPGKNWLEILHNPDNVLTWYEYNTKGQVTKQIDGYNSGSEQATTYEYDSLGRQTLVTVGFNTLTPLATRTDYRPDGQVLRTVVNPVGDGSVRTADQNITTEYGYDVLGRSIWTKLPDGSYDQYVSYNQAGQVRWVVKNPINSSGNPALPSSDITIPTFYPAFPTGNIVTSYGYDIQGRTITTTVTGIVTGTFNLQTMQWSSSTDRTTLVEYDALSRPVTTTLNYRPAINNGQYNANYPDVNLKSYTYYDAVGNPVWNKDLFHRWTKTEYDALNRPVTVTLNYENGDPSTIDAGNLGWASLNDTDIIQVTKYNQFGVDRVINNYDPRTTGVWSASAPITNLVTLNHYNSAGMQIGSTQNSAPGVTGRTDVNRTTTTNIDLVTGRTLATKDVLGQWSVPEYDTQGRVVKTIKNCRQGSTIASTNCGVSAGSSAGTIDRNVPTDTTLYDFLGRDYETVSPNGTVTHTNYDLLGRGYQTIQNYVQSPNGSTPTPYNVTASATYLDAGGRRWNTTDPTGKVTQYEANALGQTIAVTDTAGLRTSYGFDGSGTERWIKLPNGTVNLTYVDGLGRTVKQFTNYQNGILDAGDGTVKDLVVTKSYNGAGHLVATTDQIGRKTSYGYNLRGNLVKVVQNDQASCVVTDSDCRVTTVYRYDRLGNQTAIVDAHGKVRTKTYDAAGRVVSDTDATGLATRTINYEYDQRNLLTKTIGFGTGTNRPVIAVSYDELGRQRSISTAQTTVASLTVVQTYTYDVLGRRTSFFDVSAVDVGNSRTGIMTYNFDALNRIIGEQRSVIGDPVANQWTLGYGYDAAGRVTNVGSTNYQYDAAGRPWKVLRGSSLIADYSYDSVGRLNQTRNYENSIERAKTIRGYDELNRISSLTTTGINNLGANSQLSAYGYTYNRASEPETFVSNQRLTNGTVTNASHSYTYDKLGRLITEVDNGLSTTSQYAYDKLGNRASVTVNGVTNTSLSFDDAGRVTSSGWSYDAWGNVLSDGVGKNTYTYDGLNRMLTTTKAGATYGYKYHGETMILRSVANSANGNVMTPQSSLLHNTITGGYSSLLRIHSLPGAATYTTYAYGPYGGLLWSEYTNTNPVRRMAFFSDAQNTLRQQVNLTDGVTGNQDTDAWGVLTGATSPISSLRYTGEYTDFDTGLVFLRARWYNPANGTFQGRDPFAGFAEQPYSLHPYQYAYSNPMVYTDPSGRAPATSAQSLNNIPTEDDTLKNASDELCLKSSSNRVQVTIEYTKIKIDNKNTAEYIGEYIDLDFSASGGSNMIKFSSSVSVGVNAGVEAEKAPVKANFGFEFNVTKSVEEDFPAVAAKYGDTYPSVISKGGEYLPYVGVDGPRNLLSFNFFLLAYKYQYYDVWGGKAPYMLDDYGFKVGHERCRPNTPKCQYFTTKLITTSKDPLIEVEYDRYINQNNGLFDSKPLTNEQVMNNAINSFGTMSRNAGIGLVTNKKSYFRNFTPKKRGY